MLYTANSKNSQHQQLKQSTWLRITRSGGCWLRVVLHTLSCAGQKWWWCQIHFQFQLRCQHFRSSLTFRSAATNSFSSFLGNVAGVHLEKHRVTNDAVSAFTDGVLCSSEATHTSLIASRVVYTATSHAEVAAKWLHDNCQFHCTCITYFTNNTLYFILRR